MIIPSGEILLNLSTSDIIPRHFSGYDCTREFLRLFLLPKDILSAASFVVTILKTWPSSVFMFLEA